MIAWMQSEPVNPFALQQALTWNPQDRPQAGHQHDSPWEMNCVHDPVQVSPIGFQCQDLLHSLAQGIRYGGMWMHFEPVNPVALQHALTWNPQDRPQAGHQHDSPWEMNCVHDNVQASPTGFQCEDLLHSLAQGLRCAAEWAQSQPGIPHALHQALSPAVAINNPHDH